MLSTGPPQGRSNSNGVDLSTLREAALTRIRARSIGFVFQTFNLIPTLNAADNVAMALVPQHTAAAERQSRAEQALTMVGLAGRLGHLPSELSGGEQQRVAIARALVKKPQVLLADEPTGNLDQGTRDEIIGLLENLWRQHGLTMVMVTHDSSVAARAQRIGQLKHGRLAIPPLAPRSPDQGPATGPAEHRWVR